MGSNRLAWGKCRTLIIPLLAATVLACSSNAATMSPTATTVSQPPSVQPPSAQPSSAQPPSSSAQAVDIGSLGPVTINVSHYGNSPGIKASFDARFAAFKAKYPNVTINVTVKGFDDYLKVIKLALTSSDAPDVFEGNQGWGLDDELAKAGLMLPLDKYSAQYGWPAVFGNSIGQLEYSSDGKQWGTGVLYGVSPAGENVGVYYNNAKLAQLGLTAPPATADEFVALLQKAKAAGEPPIMLGAAEKWPILHVWGGILGWYQAASVSNDWIYGKTGSTFDTPENIQAATTIQDWGKAGYFGTNFNGIAYDDAWAKFAGGQGVMLIGGDWLMQGIADKMGDNVTFALFPPGPSGKHVATGSLSGSWHISTHCQHPDVAAALLASMVGPEAANDMLSANRVPVALTSPLPSGLDQHVTQLIETLNTLNAEGGLVLYSDFASPTMIDTMSSKAQELLAGRITPQQFVQAVQADWVAFHKNG